MRELHLAFLDIVLNPQTEPHHTN